MSAPVEWCSLCGGPTTADAPSLCSACGQEINDERKGTHVNETQEQKVARADHDRAQLRMPVCCNACDRIVKPGEGIDAAGRCADCETEPAEGGAA